MVAKEDEDQTPSDDAGGGKQDEEGDLWEGRGRERGRKMGGTSVGVNLGST